MSTTTIEEQIARTESKLNEVNSRHTEVYSRIVGYYRSVRNWNKGKKAEHEIRKQFAVGEFEAKTEEECENCKTGIEVNAAVNASKEKSTDFPGAVHYKCFVRKTCPNCGPVKEYLNKLIDDNENAVLNGTLIDVDTDDGLEAARKHNVMAAPTFILYDEDGEEIDTGHDINEVKELIKNEVLLITEEKFK